MYTSPAVLHRARTLFLLCACLLLTGNEAGAQTISYILPDIGTPGMNTYVEFVAPANAPGTFGSDGFFMNNPGDNLRVVCSDPADTAKVTIGPVVVSWNGRLASTQVFVHPSVQPNSSDWSALQAAFVVKLQVVVGGAPSNAEPFHIVLPQAALRPVAGQVIGEGTLGKRSRRGAMIVDSIVFGTAQVRVSTADCDPISPGNQGYLPFVLLSVGRASGIAGAGILVNAAGRDGGPGGGGGGGNYCDVTGTGSDGGGGFTGGGRGGRNGSGVPLSSDEWRQPGASTGVVVSATGTSLNGLPGGTSPAYESAGGGTGHPFGSSGLGCNDGAGCMPAGGYGGGSGQRQTRGGGGGGYATAGISVSGTGNGGLAHGNSALVPLAGGSGGAGGNPQGISVCSGEGGGGGGAVRLYAPWISNIEVYANGGAGQNRSNGPGGSGSGGGLSVETREGFSSSSVSADGGGGPLAGGRGRVRLDGPRNTIVIASPGASNFRGPSTDTSRYVPRTFLLTGTGNGEPIRVYLRSAGMPWTQIADIPVYTGNAWSLNVTLPGDEDVYFLAALQQVNGAGGDPYAAEPAWIMSQAAANTLIFKAYPRIAGLQELRMPAIVCEQSATSTVHVRNDGTGPLQLNAATFASGSSAFSVAAPAFPATVLPGDSIPVVLRFSPAPGTVGSAQDTLLLASNDTSSARNPWRIAVSASKDSLGLATSEAIIRYADLLLCAGRGADTVLTLINTGNTSMLLQEPVFTGPFSLVAPPPSSFPLRLDPAAPALQLRVRFTPAAPGTLESGGMRVRGEIPGCAREVNIALAGRADSVSATATPLLQFRTLACEGEVADSIITIVNTGTVEISIQQPVSSNPVFRVVSPTFPLRIPAGGSADVRVRFSPTASGAQSGLLLMTADPCAVPLRADLGGRRDSMALALAGLDFGLLAPASLPAEMDMLVRNTGDAVVTLDAASFAGAAPFTVVSGVPVQLPPGSAAPVRVRFADPGADGTYTDTLRVASTPGCGAARALVTASRGTAAVTLEADTLEAAPGDVVELRLYLRSSLNPRLFGASGIRVQLRYDSELLEPLDVVSGSIIAGQRIIPLTLPLLPDARGVLATFRFRAMLGRVEATPLLLDSAVGIGGALTVTTIPGAFRLTNICREGGTRLFDGSVRAQLAQNAPNPFNPETEITYTIVEQGRVQLAVYDRLGRLVERLVDAAQTAGTHRVRFNASQLPSGVYLCVLHTETMTLSRSMVLVK